MDDGLLVLEVDRAGARRAFPGVAVERVVLASLATVHGEPEWEGCRVGEVGGCAADGDAYLVSVLGHRAAAEALVAALERVGVAVATRAASPGELMAPFAELRGGSWSEPAAR